VTFARLAAPVILVHGGAGKARAQREPYEAGMARAVDAAYAILEAGGDCVDAVVEAVHVMEDDPNFNAGYGGVLNARGEVECDAGVMRGRDQKFGAVAGVRGVRNPVLLAREVLDTPQVMLVGGGAERFAEEHGIERCDPAQLITQERFQAWARWMALGQPDSRGVENDTVGAVALDVRGDLAAATSTGGRAFMPAGRVGDSPLPGCGFWADHQGAASATGAGEEIARFLLCARAVEAGAGAPPVLDMLLAQMEAEVGGDAGLIVVREGGAISAAYNTETMGHAWRGAGMDRAAVGGVEPRPPAAG